MLTENKSIKKRCTSFAKKTCSVNTLKKRVPILQWLPKYKPDYFIQDVIAGITVGLTAIPQGIAYAVIAGLPPEYGLYASLTSGFVYVVFGSCKDVTVGPTAILAAMIAKYVANYSTDFAMLAAFLSGLIELIMGILRLGFLVDFISQPVISGFTTAAALQIAAAQLKSTFGLAGSSGNYFAESVYYFVQNIKTAKLWDPILSFSTIGMLVLLKILGDGCSRTDGVFKQVRWFTSISRNAIVVVIGMIVAYVIKVTIHSEPLALIGEIQGGLPELKPPPFNTVVGNETYSFVDMIQILGTQSIMLPFVAILESIAIAKAFAGGNSVDASQELIALGLCNVIGSFAGSMPITGSFTRTALNHASGVKTPAGGITKCLLLIFALSFMTTTFYFIPKASLSGLILTAMFSMIDYNVFVKLYKSSIKELILMIFTILICLFFGLEYGIIAGVALEALILLYFNARPSVNVRNVTINGKEIIVVSLTENISYCAAEYVRKAVNRASRHAIRNKIIVIEGTHLKKIDFTVGSNLISIVNMLEKKSFKIKFLNFCTESKQMFLVIDPTFEEKFVTAFDITELIDNTIKDA